MSGTNESKDAELSAVNRIKSIIGNKRSYIVDASSVPLDLFEDDNDNKMPPQSINDEIKTKRTCFSSCLFRDSAEDRNDGLVDYDMVLQDLRAKEIMLRDKKLALRYQFLECHNDNQQKSDIARAIAAVESEIDFCGVQIDNCKKNMRRAQLESKETPDRFCHQGSHVGERLLRGKSGLTEYHPQSEEPPFDQKKAPVVPSDLHDFAREIFKEIVEEVKRADEALTKADDARQSNVRLSNHKLQKAAEAYHQAQELFSKWDFQINEILSLLNEHNHGSPWISCSEKIFSSEKILPSRAHDGGRFPIYVLLDTCASSSTYAGELNGILESLFEQLANDAHVYELAAICIVEFNSVVGINMLVPLSRIWDIDINSINGCSFACRGTWLIDPALKQIVDMARKDLHFNSADGYPADYRPLLVIISAGPCSNESANEDCHATTAMYPSAEAINKLKSFPWEKIVACGVGCHAPSELLSITENVVDFADLHNFFCEIIHADSARPKSKESVDFV